MSTVFITGGGTKYHSSADCEGLRDGQEEALARGHVRHEIRSAPLKSLASSRREPCQRCWSHHPDWNQWLPHQLKVEMLSGGSSVSEHELFFLRDVLMKIPHLEPTDVEVQPEIERPPKAPCRPDFSIRIGASTVLVECDGLNKGLGQLSQEQVDERDDHLRGLGYRVLRFKNYDIVHDPGSCRRRISSELSSIASTAQQTAPTRGIPGEMSNGPWGHDPATPTSASSSSAASRETPSASSRPQEQQGPWVVAQIGVVVLTLVLLAGIGLLTIYLLNRGSDDSRAFPDGSGQCDDDHPIKGNVTDDGEQIYHQPGQAFYDQTSAEDCFSSTKAAEGAGYRASLR